MASNVTINPPYSRYRWSWRGRDHHDIRSSYTRSFEGLVRLFSAFEMVEM